MKIHLIQLLFISGICIFATSCGETQERFYPAYSDAVKDGAVERGWIPAMLSTRAFDIHERHNLDSNSSVLAFKAASFSKTMLSKECKPVEAKDIRPPRIIAAWFPENIVLKPYEFYSCENGDSYLALSESEGLGFFWRP